MSRFQWERGRFHIVLAWLAIVLAVISLWMNFLSPIVRAFFVALPQLDVVKFSALVVASCALIVAWNNFRRGNTAVIKLVKVQVSASTTMGVNNAKPYNRLDIDLKNLGIPLKNPSISLTAFTRHGSLNFPLYRYKGDAVIPNDGTLEKGMIARYGLRSFEIQKHQWMMIEALASDSPQDVGVLVFSEGFRVTKIPFVQGWRRWLIQKWNNFAWRINPWFAYKIKRWDKEFSHLPAPVKVLPDPFRELEHFYQWSKADRERTSGEERNVI